MIIVGSSGRGAAETLLDLSLICKCSLHEVVVDGILTTILAETNATAGAVGVGARARHWLVKTICL